MKRTEQLRLSQEVALPACGDGVFTTLDQLELSPDEQQELDHKLSIESPFRAEVEQIVQQVITMQAAAGEVLQRAWGDAGNFNVVIDGCTIVGRLGDKVVRVLDVARVLEIPESHRAAVQLTLAKLRAAARGEPSTK